MSYFSYPRLHFSGKFIADPCTVNNYPGNYDVKGDISKMKLYWNPGGTGGFDFEDCLITKVEYSEDHFATTPEEDSIIGQSFAAIKQFYLSSGLVDLDPRQMMVSTLFGMDLQIGGDEENIKGEFSSTPFNGIWNFPLSTASATYQGQISSLGFSSAPSSQFLQKISSADKLSINFAVNQYNNVPQIYSFNDQTFESMLDAGIPQDIIDKFSDLKDLSLYQGEGGFPFGDIPTLSYVTSLLISRLTTEEYNLYQTRIFEITQKAYTPSSPFEFTKGLVVGTVGPAFATDPAFVVASRALAPQVSDKSFVYFSSVETNQKSTAYLNFSNALKIDPYAGVQPSVLKYSDVGNIYLATFSGAAFKSTEVSLLHDTPLDLGGDCLVKNAGFITQKLNADISSTSVCLVKETSPAIGASPAVYRLLHQENLNGYFMRADKFVYRMNPGDSDPTYGDTETFDIHVYQYGEPVTDPVEIKLSLSYFDINGEELPIPSDDNALSFASNTAATSNGIASFTMTCTEPPAPADNLDGQVYSIEYQFSDSNLEAAYTLAPGDSLSVHVYQSETTMTGQEVLKQYGEIYPIMGFLKSEAAIATRKPMILNLLQYPIDSINHMPVTRDMSTVKRDKAIAWLESLTTVTIQADVAWQKTGFQVSASDTVNINYLSGEWTANPSNNGGELYNADGDPTVIVAESGYTLAGKNEGALIGKVGTTIFYVGLNGQVPSGVTGELELCINDDIAGEYGAGLSDNKGRLTVGISKV